MRHRCLAAAAWAEWTSKGQGAREIWQRRSRVSRDLSFSRSAHYALLAAREIRLSNKSCSSSLILRLARVMLTINLRLCRKCSKVPLTSRNQRSEIREASSLLMGKGIPIQSQCFEPSPKPSSEGINHSGQTRTWRKAPVPELQRAIFRSQPRANFLSKMRRGLSSRGDRAFGP